MKDAARIRDRLRDRQGQRMLTEEMAILDVTEMICALMDEQGVSRSELAERMGVSRSSISQMLNGERNLTVRKIAAILFEMERELKVCSVPRAPVGQRGAKVIKFEGSTRKPQTANYQKLTLHVSSTSGLAS